MTKKQKLQLILVAFLAAEIFLAQTDLAFAANQPSYIGSGAQASIEKYLCHPTDPVAGQTNAAANDVYTCINNIYRFAIVLAVSISVLMIVIAGYLYMSADGDQEAVSKAKSYVTNSLIAILILLIGYVLLRALNPDLIKFQTIQPNSVTGAAGTTAVTGQPATGGSTPAGATGGGNAPATAAHTINQNICQGTPNSSCSSNCSAYSSFISQAAQQFPVSGVNNTAALIQSIIANESSCSPNAQSAANSFGLMQLQVSTAQQFAPACGVDPSIIDSGGSWLKQASNAKSVICIGTAYLQSLASSCGSLLNIAAGYNGGAKACAPSVDCTGNSCDGTSPAKAWECPYDDPTQNVPNQGYAQSRQYAPAVLGCYNQLSPTIR